MRAGARPANGSACGYPRTLPPHIEALRAEQFEVEK